MHPDSTAPDLAIKHRLLIPSGFVASENNSSLSPAAFSDLSMLQRNVCIPGFALWAVQKWALDRSRPLCTIAVWTGSPEDTVTVDILGFEADQSDEQKALRWNRIEARFRLDSATPHIVPDCGVLFVVGLTNFTTELNIVRIPNGDYIASRQKFYLNLNLAQLDLQGRTGFSLGVPNNAQQDLFLSMYKLPPASLENQLSFAETVLTFIKLLQSALALFGYGPFVDRRSITDVQNNEGELPAEPDGLLCNETMKAIQMWKEEGGPSDLTKPADPGPLPSSLIAQLFSLLICMHYRLSKLYSGRFVHDPLRDRSKFARLLVVTLKEIRTTPNSPIHSSLTTAVISLINATYEGNTGGRHKDVTRMLRDKIGDIGDRVTIHGGSVELTHGADSITEKIDDFALFVKHGLHKEFETLQAVWQGRYPKIKHQSSSLREKDVGPFRRRRNKHSSKNHQSDHTATETENEGGFTKLLKGVTQKTGKVSKMMGDSVSGLLPVNTPRTSSNVDLLKPVDEENRARSPKLSVRSFNIGRFEPSRSPSPEVSQDLSRNASTSAYDFSIATSDHHRPMPPAMRRAATDMGFEREYSSADSGCVTDRKHQGSAPHVPKRRWSFAGWYSKDLANYKMHYEMDRLIVDMELHYGIVAWNNVESELAQNVDRLMNLKQLYGREQDRFSDRLDLQKTVIKELEQELDELRRKLRAIKDDEKDEHPRIDSNKHEDTIISPTAAQRLAHRRGSTQTGVISPITPVSATPVVPIANFTTLQTNKARLDYAQDTLDKKLIQLKRNESGVLTRLANSEDQVVGSPGTSLVGESGEIGSSVSGILELQRREEESKITIFQRLKRELQKLATTRIGERRPLLSKPTQGA